MNLMLFLHYLTLSSCLDFPSVLFADVVFSFAVCLLPPLVNLLLHNVLFLVLGSSLVLGIFLVLGSSGL